jgi:hypothetical protein
MLDRTDASPARRTRRRFGCAVGVVGVVLAVVIDVQAVLLVATPACACTSPTDLVVLNYAHEEAGVSWQGRGLYGTPILAFSGSATVSACATLLVALRPGPVDVSVRAGGDAHTVRVDVPQGQARYGHPATIVIEADLRISGPDDVGPSTGELPPDRFCN